MPKALDLTGMKFNMLTVLKMAEPMKDSYGRYVLMWKCKCDCGNEVLESTVSLTKGRIKSCGCLQRERAREANTKHGMYKSRIYNIYKSLFQRFGNPKEPSFPNYGGRGIKVCGEWSGENGFNNFYEWSIKTDMLKTYQ